MSVCGSGLREPVAYSLFGGGVLYPEHRLHWYLDSVPSIRFLCFPSWWFGPFLPPPPLQDSSRFLALQHLSRLLSLSVLSASSPPVSVYSADLLQCLVPHRPSPIVLPSESYQPSGYRPTNVFIWFPDPASHLQVCTPPQPMRLVVLSLGVGVGGKETAPPAMERNISALLGIFRIYKQGLLYTFYRVYKTIFTWSKAKYGLYKKLIILLFVVHALYMWTRWFYGTY